MAKKKQMIEHTGPFYTVQEKPFDVATKVFVEFRDNNNISAIEFKAECERRWKEILKQYK